MRFAYVLSAALPPLLLSVHALAAPPPLPAEHLTVEPLPPKSPHWVYVFDESFYNEIDARVHLFDGDSYRRLGQIDAGFTPSMNLSPDGNTTVVATTYFARGSRGARTDVVEFTDNTTLAVTHEIVLPPKRAQTSPTLFGVSYSPDGHFLYTAYMTPAASFGVLDPQRGTVLSEIDTAGCVLVIPSGPNRVSSLCESGRLLTVTLDAQGHETARAMSEPFFDPDKDPLFAQGIQTSQGFAFLTFLGQVHEVDFSGAQPVFAPSWSLVNATEHAWRPGAEQVGAIHRALGRLYVLMHQGGEGTHKDGGSEIWVFDMASHGRVARWPLPLTQMGAAAVTIQVTQDRAPLLFAATGKGTLAVIDGLTGHVRHIERQLAQTPWMMMTP
jgi:methylamine dehydrogenase heavy chain